MNITLTNRRKPMKQFTFILITMALAMNSSSLADDTDLTKRVADLETKVTDVSKTLSNLSERIKKLESSNNNNPPSPPRPCPGWDCKAVCGGWQGSTFRYYTSYATGDGCTAMEAYEDMAHECSNWGGYLYQDTTGKTRAGIEACWDD